jgi:hypothetical protein
MSSYYDGTRQQFILTSSNQHTVCCVFRCHTRKGRSLRKPNSHCYKKKIKIMEIMRRKRQEFISVALLQWTLTIKIYKTILYLLPHTHTHTSTSFKASQQTNRFVKMRFCQKATHVFLFYYWRINVECGVSLPTGSSALKTTENENKNIWF